MPFVKHQTCLPKRKFVLKNHQHNRGSKGCIIHMQCLGGIHSKYGCGQFCPNLHRQCFQHAKYIKHLEGCAKWCLLGLLCKFYPHGQGILGGIKEVWKKKSHLWENIACHEDIGKTCTIIKWLTIFITTKLAIVLKVNSNINGRWWIDLYYAWAFLNSIIHRFSLCSQFSEGCFTMCY